MVQVRRLGQQDWKTLRDVRLAALADAPYAFWATFQEESRFGPEQWRRFLKAAAWWTASRNDRVVGVVAVLRRGEILDEAELIAMWVAPDERGRGTAARMLQAACEWARAAGTQTLTLWVTEGNDRAKRLYESWGFQATGERADLPHTAATGEERMRLRLSDPTRTTGR
jgi:GNAT superfamily N-acetyltransferase